MGSLALTAPDSWGFLSGSTLYGGVASGFAGSGINAPGVVVGANRASYYVGATVATPVTGLRMGGSFDYLDPRGGDIYGMSLAGYLSYQATEKLSFHARAEYFKEKGPILFASTRAEVMALTGTIQYDLWKNVISRLEVRWDHSLNDAALFGGTASAVAPLAPISPTSDNAVVIAANIIYKF
jgi:hypothetical protein